jgi:hypothetical protein
MRDATEILAITDSVRTFSGKAWTDSRTRRKPRPAPPCRSGYRVMAEWKLAPARRRRPAGLLGQMPPTLSRKAVAVGEKWVHEMRVPLPGEPGAVGRFGRPSSSIHSAAAADSVHLDARSHVTRPLGRKRFRDVGDTRRQDAVRPAPLVDHRDARHDRCLVRYSGRARRKAAKPMRVHTRVYQSLRVDAQ